MPLTQVVFVAQNFSAERHGSALHELASGGFGENAFDLHGRHTDCIAIHNGESTGWTAGNRCTQHVGLAWDTNGDGGRSVDDANAVRRECTPCSACAQIFRHASDA